MSDVKTPKGFARFIIVLTTVSAAVMELIDTSIVNVGLNQIAGSLGVTIEDISWVITAYAIANVIIIPLTGFLAEYFGRKSYYIASMLLTISSETTMGVRPLSDPSAPTATSQVFSCLASILGSMTEVHKR